MRAKHPRVFLSLLLLLCAACSKDDKKSEESGDEIEWPKAPGDGTPLALEFLAMEGSGEQLGAKMRAFNFSDKEVVGFSATLHYFDESGKELKSFPWSHQAAGALAEAKGHAEVVVGAFVPEETAKVTAEIKRVSFKGGAEWKRDE